MQAGKSVKGKKTMTVYSGPIYDEEGTLAVGTYKASFFWQEFREDFNPSTAQPKG